MLSISLELPEFDFDKQENLDCSYRIMVQKHTMKNVVLIVVSCLQLSTTDGQEK